MESDSTLINAVDAEATATGSVDQRFSLARYDAEALLDLTFVVGMIHGAHLHTRRSRRRVPEKGSNSAAGRPAFLSLFRRQRIDSAKMSGNPAH
jgi:hypothetical protein